MIIDKEVEVRANSKHLKYYKDLGYNPVLTGRGKGDTFKVKIEHLSKHSHMKILCSCDICGKEKYVKYLNYNLYIENNLEGKYTCEKCNGEKRKLTCMKLYGAEFVSQNNEIKSKKLETMKKNGKKLFWCRKEEHKAKIVELYGVENISQNKSIKEKIKETCLEKYGVEHPSQNIDIHLKQHKNFISNHVNNLYYRSSYEKNFIEYCVGNGIEINNFSGTINYLYKNKNKKYFPDFYFKPLNLIIEIKSSYTYEIEKIINNLKKDYSIKNGYNYLFIIDNNFKEFEKIINKKPTQ